MGNLVLLEQLGRATTMRGSQANHTSPLTLTLTGKDPVYALPSHSHIHSPHTLSLTHNPGPIIKRPLPLPCPSL